LEIWLFHGQIQSSLSLFHACIIACFAGVLCASPTLCSAGMIHCVAWRSTGTEQ
jgi:hypothetical protein